MSTAPNASEQLTLRAEMLLERHRPQDAEDHFRQALAANPENADAHFGLARCLAQDARRPHKALEEMDRALALKPNHPGFHAYRAILLAQLGRPKPARQAIQSALEIAPNFAYAWSCSALIEQADRKWKAMEKAARQALMLEPEDPDHANLLAVALRRQRRFEEASKVLQGSLSMDPENAETHHQNGWQLLSSNREQAEQHFYEALRLSPHHDGARQGMLESFKRRNGIYSKICHLNDGLTAFFSRGLFLGTILFFVVTTALAFFALITVMILNDRYSEWVIAGYLMVLLSPVLLFFAFMANQIIGSVMVLVDQRARLALTRKEIISAWLTVGVIFLFGCVVLLSLVFEQSH